MHAPFGQTIACRRLDLTSPALVFAGVFLAASAICGTLEAVNPSLSAADDVQTISDEYAVGPGAINPVAYQCNGGKAKKQNGIALASAGRSSSSNCDQKSSQLKTSSAAVVITH